ncbi:MAG: hypothetical protein ACE5EO_05010 [Candidatus Krumholzibacteriia bacterium]
MRILVLVVVCLGLCSPALAGPPLNGSYTSTDLGGAILTGRYAESWATAGGMLQVDNTLNKQSWDGATLGTQWQMTCPSVSATPVLLFSTVDVNGNGQETYRITWTGGSLELSGTGPWGNLEPSYTALFTSFVTITTVSFQSHQVVSVISNTQISATFVGFDDACVTFAITNLAQFGSTDTGPVPPGYPGFLDPNSCLATRTFGSWGSVTSITMTIAGCTIPVEELTWGSIKALYE